MTVRSQNVRYQADGLEMIGEFYHDDSIAGARPGVVVFPEAFGLGNHARSRAERLAGLGYAALACDLHGGGRLLPDLDSALAELAPLFQDAGRTRARAQGGLDALIALAEVDAARVAAIGYCFGGTMSLELGRSGAALRAIVGFHSGLSTTTPQDARNITAKVLVCIGADDPAIDAAQRAAFEAEMRQASVDWRMHLYGGVIHSFTNKEADSRGRPDFLRYDASADKRSWSEMLALLNEAFTA